MVTHTDQRPPWYNLARDALYSAIARDNTAAAEQVLELGDRYGQAWPEILYTWIDVLLAANGHTTADYGRRDIKVQVQNIDTGRINDPAAPDPVSWMTALIAARFQDDRDAYYDLMRQVPPERAFEYVGAVLQAVGITVGMALQGTLAPKEGQS